MHAPRNIQAIGHEIAIVWDDGVESYLPFARLRAASPSAETQGERDIFGQQYGGNGPRKFDGVVVTGWEQVGNYAVRFDFSDGHGSGLYTYDYLRKLGAAQG
jgi:DUF971 family protein